MRITIDLEQADVDRLLRALRRAHRLARSADETDVLSAAKHALNTLPIGSAPAYVRKRIGAVQRLIIMLEDDAWALPKPERTRVLDTLVYFSDPEDLIPDEIEVIGLLDDAIVLELLLRRQRHVMDAYADFCECRRSLRLGSALPEARLDGARRLAQKRQTLQARMRRRSGRKVAAAT